LYFGKTRLRAGRQYRVAGEAFIVEFIAVSIGMKEFSKEHFRPGVFAFYSCHILAACFFGVDVCHSVKVGIALSFALMRKKQRSRKIRQWAAKPFN